jgi:hypothetical protein
MTMNSLEVLASLIVFSARDWGEMHNDALIYGIVVGWDEAAMRDVADRFNLDENRVELLRKLHADFQARLEPGS